MALWYDCGNGWVRARGLARCNLGADAYLCCPGPSLAALHAAALNGPGRMIFAVTTAYPAVRPDVWVGTDVPECYDRRVWAEPFIKIVRGSHHDESCQGRPLKDFPNVFFADLEDAPVSEIFRRRAHDTVFVWNRNTFTTALHLVVWAGARRVFLVGCDFGGGRDYHDGRRLAEGRRADNRRLYANLVQDLHRLAPEGRAQRIEIVSCTSGSPVNEFLPFVELKDALRSSEAEAPDGHAPLLHAADAELCQWDKRILHERGVAVALGAGLEWLAPWWFENLRRHSELPVAFADFGVSEAMRRWCSDRGSVIDLRNLPVRRTSSRMPFAILRSPFKEILLLEPDCEVRGSLEPLFRYCRDGSAAIAGGVAEAATKGDRSGKEAEERATGPRASDVVAAAVRHGSALVADWAAEVQAREDRYATGREALAQVTSRCGYAVSPIPSSLVSTSSSSHDRDSGAAVLHWAGAEGKAALQRRLGGGSSVDVSPRAAARPVAWAAEPADTLGVVVPVCENQQDLAAWWWWAYARRNRWPVAFADFGMSDETRRWCEVRGKVVPHGAPDGVEGCFRRPFAILQSPFRQTVWADLDCEVRADLSVLASFCGDRPGLGRDWSYPVALGKRLSFQGPCWSGAVIVCRHGDPLVVEWARKVPEGRDRFRGDQEILSKILGGRRRSGFAEIPATLLRSRQEGEDEGLTAVHWSGPGGKGAIRRAWPAIRAGLCPDMRCAFWRDWANARPSAERGVVVGLDSAQEWLLPWWWSNYAKYNDLPVHFADFGMSQEVRRWCESRGTLSEPIALDCYGYFKKPLALLQSPFRQGVWLDTDCEVRGALGPLFEFCAEGGIGMAPDRGTPQRCREAMPRDAPIYNSGVLAFNHGDPAVPQWASMTLALRSDRPGDARYGQPGDQETLALTLRRYAEGRIREIPKEILRLRLSDGDGPCLVMHWTGPVGKQHIRDAMNLAHGREAAAIR